jgi:hypothetical protein
MFKDATGAISMMRVCMFLIVVTICGVYLFQNILSVIHGQGLVSLNATDVSALGLALVAKFGQNFTEKEASLDQPEKPPVEQSGN